MSSAQRCLCICVCVWCVCVVCVVCACVWCVHVCGVCACVVCACGVCVCVVCAILKTPFKVRGLSGISIGIIMGVTLTPGYVAAVALLLAVRGLDNSIWKAGGSIGCARLLTGLNCSVSEPMGVPLTPPWVVDLQYCWARTIGPYFCKGCWLNLH